MLKSRTQNYVCQCGKRFESSMSLSVHCSLVGHKFAEHFNTNQHRKTREPSDRKKILTQTLPVCISLHFFHFLTYQIYCYACPRASKHTDLAEFTTHVIEKHLSIREKEKKGAVWNLNIYPIWNGCELDSLEWKSSDRIRPSKSTPSISPNDDGTSLEIMPHVL